MAAIFGGHVVARYLRQIEGVDIVFALSGGHIDRIFDGMLEYGIRIIDVRHEQAAAMMAQAFSIYTGRPGVCLVTAGPGFTNALTGVANAFLDNIPMVLLTGTAPIRDWDKGALQEMNQADMIKPISKWAGRCHDPKRIPEYLNLAFRQAVSGRPGPVFLELPPDVLNVRVELDDISMPASGCRRFAVRPDSDSVKAAAEAINAAERPLLIGGSGVGYSQCDGELKQLIETAGLPFLLLNNGRGTLPDDHPLSLWDGGNVAMLTAMPMADLVVAIGIRYNWLLMFGQTFPQAKVVRIDIDCTEIDRNRRADIGLVGDAGLVIKDVNAFIAKRDRTAWRRELRDLYMPMLADDIKNREKTSAPIHPVRLIEQIRTCAGSDAFYVIDGGDTSYFALMGLKTSHKHGIIASSSGLLGCLGTGIPFAMAAKLAHPDRRVVLVCGDGSFGLNGMEYDTAVRHCIPFTCVINNDQAWGMIKHGQEMNYGGERVCGSTLGVVHYEKMVEGLGGHGEFVTEDAELIPALGRAFESGKPACVNVLTDPTVTSPATMLFVESLKIA